MIDVDLWKTEQTDEETRSEQSCFTFSTAKCRSHDDNDYVEIGKLCVRMQFQSKFLDYIDLNYADVGLSVPFASSQNERANANRRTKNHREQTATIRGRVNRIFLSKSREGVFISVFRCNGITGRVSCLHAASGRGHPPAWRTSKNQPLHHGSLVTIVLSLITFLRVRCRQVHYCGCRWRCRWGATHLPGRRLHFGTFGGASYQTINEN